MHPILLKFGPFTIYSYGVMVAMGFGIATFLARARAAKFNIDPGKIIDIAILLIVSGIAGARDAIAQADDDIGTVAANPGGAAGNAVVERRRDDHVAGIVRMQTIGEMGQKVRGGRHAVGIGLGARGTIRR